MNDPTSLDRLHDIVLPEAVPWWPPAPGWYLLAALLFFAALLLTARSWRRWRASAYRREALRELASADDATAVSELLRRTALAVAPRETVAQLTGEAWPAWLAERRPAPIPAGVREDLALGAYDPQRVAEVEALRDYAANWIRLHPAPEAEED